MDNHLKNYIQEYMIPHNSLIGAWTIDESVCDELIQYHKNSKDNGLVWLINNKHELTLDF